MSTALYGVYIVCKGDHRLLIFIVVLNCYFCGFIVSFGTHIDNVVKHVCVFQRIEMLDKAFYSAFIEKNFFSRLFFSFVGNGYRYSGIEKCLLAHTVENNIVIEYGCFFENIAVGHKTNVKTVIFSVTSAYASERTGYIALFKAFGIYFSFVTVFDLCPIRKSVYDRRADSVQTA